jgi:superfamily I DNA/RNA helicase
LHGWSKGNPPFKLDEHKAEAQLKFLLPMARWLEVGAPVPEEELFDMLMIDESQDMSWVELRAALSLVHAGGEVWAFGDPGQAVFGTPKGMTGNKLPPVWERADTHTVMSKGYRVGNPVAGVAAKALKSWYDRPAHTFAAGHSTRLHVWDCAHAPRVGLVMGYSRASVAKAFVNWGLRQTGVVPKVAEADKELVLSTGHAAKGAEADDVYLLPWSRVAMERLQQKDPATLRLLYVMLTRGRKRVHVPRTLRARLL